MKKFFDKSDIAEITLLSVEEYKEARDVIPNVHDSWWLRTPGYYYNGGCRVDYYGGAHSFGSFVYSNYGIRPAFRVNNLQSTIGDKVFVGDIRCTTIFEDMVLSDFIIDSGVFDDESNDYESSDIKNYLNSDEFAERIGLKN